MLYNHLLWYFIGVLAGHISAYYVFGWRKHNNKECTSSASYNTQRNAILLAMEFHKHYEELAPTFGYTTREESAVPWSNVPENNRKLMVAVCEKLIKQNGIHL